MICLLERDGKPTIYGITTTSYFCLFLIFDIGKCSSYIHHLISSHLSRDGNRLDEWVGNASSVFVGLIDL